MPQPTHPNTNPELTYLNSMLNKTLQNRDLALLLFKKLFQELPKQITQLEQTLLAQEFNQAQAIIHKLHGSVSFCGFSELQELANGVESNLLHDNLDLARSLFLLLKQEVLLFQSLQDRILQQLEKQD